MKMFFVKSFLFLATMFLCVLIGMQQANIGIHNMKGYDDPNMSSPLVISEDDTGKYQASILGKDVSSHDLEKKKEKLAEMNAYNIFSSIGKKLSESVSAAANNVIEFVMEKIDN